MKRFWLLIWLLFLLGFAAGYWLCFIQELNTTQIQHEQDNAASLFMKQPETIKL